MGKDFANMNYQLEISKSIGEPISKQLPVPVELSAIADSFTAEPGEKIWRYTATDTALDICLAINTSTGAMVPVKRQPTADAELTFTGLQSKMEYVLIDDILAETDNVSVLARRKDSITRSMDKRELYTLLTAILDKTAGYVPGVNVQEYTLVSGDDLYDGIVGMKHLVENYGDNYAFLCGSSVKEGIDTYDKDQAGALNYNVRLSATLKDLGIEVMKVFGTVELTDGGGETNLIDSKKAVLVARNSRIAEGKPIKFVRRKISPAIAQLMGADIDSAQRALVVGQVPVIISETNTYGYSIHGYESVVMTITCPYSICICDFTSIL